MIWFNLLLLVVSFIAIALLAPKPEFEDARAESFDDVRFPKATENAPIPLILGKVRNEGPNTIWYGNYSTEAITERIRTGLFSSTKVIVGYRYFLTLDMALGLGDDISLHEIYIDEEQVWTGDTAEAVETSIIISDSDLFGGHKEGGGWESVGTFYSGSFTQTINSHVEGLVGVGEVPAYRGTSHITFENAYIGESANLRKMAFVCSKYTDGLSLGVNAKIGDDINPAEALFQIMTDDWVGLNIEISQLDILTFQNVGNVLASEGNGCSVMVAKESQARNVLTEILRQIDGIMYQDPETGLIVLKLIREDYVAADLDIYDEDDIVNIKNFSRTSWDEVRGQVKVNYKQRDKESDAVAVAQDSGVIASTGKTRTNSITFPFLYNAATAQDIAARELAQASVPLFRCEVEFNRNAYKLRPGDVLKVSWPNYGFQEIVFRVQKFDFGKLTEGRMVANLLQDNFAVNATVFASKEDSGWVPPVTSPSDVVAWGVPEMPYFYTQRLQFPINDGKAMVVPLPKPASTSSSSFDFLHSAISGGADDTGVDAYRDPQSVSYPATGTISAAYGLDAGQATGLDATGFTLEGVEGDFVAAASASEMIEGEVGILWANGEWLGFTSATDNMDGTWDITNVYRGLLGTTPKDHPLGTRFYQVTPDFFGRGYNDEITDTGTLYYKILDRVASTVQSSVDFTQQTVVMTAEANSPMRPRNLQMDATRTAIEAGPGSNVSLSWVASDRTEINEITLEQDAAETPDQAETYDVEVWIGGVQAAGLAGSGVSSPYSIPFTTTDLSAFTDAEAEVRVYSRRTGGDLRTSNYYGVLKFDYVLANVLLSGDEQSGTDGILLSGDAQSGTDLLNLSGDES